MEGGVGAGTAIEEVQIQLPISINCTSRHSSNWILWHSLSGARSCKQVY